jgi:hypothetical protein
MRKDKRDVLSSIMELIGANIILIEKSEKKYYLGNLDDNIKIFNVENINLRVYKWNETVSNRICNVSDEMC